MAAAVIGGLNLQNWKVGVAEVYEPTRKAIQHRFPSITVVSSPNHDFIKSCQIIMFAVKPQSVKDLLASLQSIDFSGKIIASLMAGITISKLKEGLKGTDIQFIRYMPNTPLLVGKGVTGVFPETDFNRNLSQELLGASSQLFYFQTEESLDRVTAISGSGPAYFFAFIECLRNAGLELGFAPEVANRMAIGTALGASTLAANSTTDVVELRQQVTSKGGTTAAALDVFSQSHLDEIVKNAVYAAYHRSQELAKL